MRKSTLLFLFGFLFVLSLTVFPQAVGQYEDEAPLASWNILGPLSGRSGSLGGITVVLSNDPASIFTNPASLSNIGGATVAGSVELLSARLFRYSIVNTGVIVSLPRNEGGLGSGFVAFLYPLRGFNLAFAFGRLENISRPTASFTTGWGEKLSQTFGGWTNIFSFGVSKNAGRFSFGFGAHYLSGYFSKNLNYTLNEGISFAYYTDEAREDFSGYYFTLGTTFKPTPKLTLGLSLRTPYERKGEGRVRREMKTSQVDIIGDYRSGDDRYQEPLAFLFGSSYQVSGKLLLLMEVDYLRWSSYRVTYFSEDLPRNFDDTLLFRLGAEYTFTAVRNGRRVSLPLRVGYLYDPQPVTYLRYRYHYLTLGGGFSFARFSCDLAFQYGFERSSGENLSNVRFITSISYRF